MKLYILAIFILLTSCTLSPNNDPHESTEFESPPVSLQPSSYPSPQSTPQPSTHPISESKQLAHSMLKDASSNQFDDIENIVGGLDKEELDELLKYVLTYWHQYSYKNQEDLQLVSLLLEKGADPNGVDDDGMPLLFIARTADMLKVLAEDERANLNARTPYGNTLLLSAIGGYNSEKVDYLLHRGVDPNEDSYSNEESYPNEYKDWSPLHLAIAYADYEDLMMPIVESLLNHKDIDLTKVDEENRTPYELALQLERTAVLELFEKKGLVNSAD
ncbi:ankyrin repeat domain-containing protein [Paenibacillus sp. 32O-W]|uniref:ankyrin repeat domain-containing protein n=1 Tax=Paenibacillus sp. 32O-W TaxID=1695218 RepID=UPI0011A588F5|nr:ankyrin repeat domain-containing protein [Paenibacillus sp. 32O-W]